MNTELPRLIIAGLSGDSGKTIVSLSLLAALRRNGLSAIAFKKGPDYIDAAWLGRLAGAPCRNLDTYMVAPEIVRERFMRHGAGADIALIEGNRGLFDGRDAAGTHSTAELAKLLQAPVLLVVNAAKTTRTVAALIKGCQAFAPDIVFAGVVLNRTAGKRHTQVITEAVERYCGLPVLGVLPKLSGNPGLIPSRHLGLVTPAESGKDAEMEDRLADIGAEHLDIERILAAARKTAALPAAADLPAPRQLRARIGYFSDPVFTFYYPENLEALAAQGAELVPISSIVDGNLPDIDGLYIGGGFPETHAQRLADNTAMMASVRSAAKAGLPIYAECGGLIYLAKSITWKGHRYPMCGLFPLDLRMQSKPAGHGYTLLKVDRPNPFFAQDVEIKGHEFHYSALKEEPEIEATCMRVEIGAGLGGRREGLVKNNVLACYTHIHSDAVSSWAPGFLARADEYRLRLAKPLLKLAGRQP
ncbi:MAG: cobyrinate a,c-diamide synthase [Elusimicrobiota bacterium]